MKTGSDERPRHVPARGRLPPTARTACPSPPSRATSAGWAPTGRQLPAPERRRAHRLPASTSTAPRRGRAAPGVTTNAFDGAPFAELVRDRLAAVVDDGRAPEQRVQRMPSPCTDGGRAPRLVRPEPSCSGEVTRAKRTSVCSTNRSSRGSSSTAAVPRVSRCATSAAANGTRSARGSGRRGRCASHAAAALGLGHPTRALGRYLTDRARVVFASRLRDVEPPPADPVAASGALSEQSG